MQPVARTVTIDAPPERVWEVIADVRGWPRWATYMRRLELLDGRPLGPASRVKVTPKGLPSAIWTVTEYEPPRSYTWTAPAVPGLTLTGGHLLSAAAGGTAATFSLAAAGPLAAPLAPLLRAIFRRNTRLATEGLRRWCEAHR